MHTLILFASGRGSNACSIINYFEENGVAQVGLIVANKDGLGVLEMADEKGIPTLVANDASLASEAFLQKLLEIKPSLIVLAGFLAQNSRHINR